MNPLVGSFRYVSVVREGPVEGGVYVWRNRRYEVRCGRDQFWSGGSIMWFYRDLDA